MEPKPISAYAARGGSAVALKKVRYTHDAMIDLILAEPRISQNELAAHFGYTPTWISQVINSDAFRERLAERKEDLVDPQIRTSIEERLRALADKSIQVLLTKLHETNNMNVAVRTLDVATRSLGYGAKTSAAVQINNYVAHIPPRAPDSGAWVNGYSQPQSVALRPPSAVNQPED